MKHNSEMRNLQHRTSNIEHPKDGSLRRQWMLGVGCWMFDVPWLRNWTGLATLVSAALLCLFQPASATAQTNQNPRDFSAFQLINDRNIFDPNRRPRVERVRSVPSTPQIVDTFSLVGTMSYSNVLLAFFDGSSSDYRKSLKVGDRIATFGILAIQHNTVKLAAETNEVELRIGMQMRRSEDGTWNAAEASQNSSTSYASNDRGNRDRGERRWNRSSDSGASSQSASSDSATPAPAPGNLDPSDPVQRMILRRMQEEGRGTPPPQTEAPAAPPDNAVPVPAPETISVETSTPQPPENDFVPQPPPNGEANPD